MLFTECMVVALLIDGCLLLSSAMGDGMPPAHGCLLRCLGQLLPVTLILVLSFSRGTQGWLTDCPSDVSVTMRTFLSLIVFRVGWIATRVGLGSHVTYVPSKCVFEGSEDNSPQAIGPP